MTHTCASLVRAIPVGAVLHVRCRVYRPSAVASGSWVGALLGGQRLSVAAYVAMTQPTDEAIAGGCR